MLHALQSAGEAFLDRLRCFTIHFDLAFSSTLLHFSQHGRKIFPMLTKAFGAYLFLRSANYVRRSALEPYFQKPLIHSKEVPGKYTLVFFGFTRILFEQDASIFEERETWMEAVCRVPFDVE